MLATQNAIELSMFGNRIYTHHILMYVGVKTLKSNNVEHYLFYLITRKYMMRGYFLMHKTAWMHLQAEECLKHIRHLLLVKFFDSMKFKVNHLG